MTTTIIIPDIHNRIGWVEPFLESVSYNKVIFLGDYFDDWNDNPSIATNVAKWLKQSLKQEDRLHLIGTHDLYYMFPNNEHLLVSGNTFDKSDAINRVLSREDWDKLLLVTDDQNFIISHAGISLDHVDMKLGIHQGLFSELNRVFHEISRGKYHKFVGAGTCRGGFQATGGVIWLDWNHEFEPIEGINQIVGHTQLKYPAIKRGVKSINYNIDTKNKHYIQIKDKVVTIHPVSLLCEDFF